MNDADELKKYRSLGKINEILIDMLELIKYRELGTVHELRVLKENFEKGNIK